MAKYRVEAREKFVMFTTYEVEAASPEEAEAKCVKGEAYLTMSPDDNPGQWIETVSVTLLEATPADKAT